TCIGSSGLRSRAHAEPTRFATDSTWMPASWRGCTQGSEQEWRLSPMDDGVAGERESSRVVARNEQIMRIGIIGWRGMVGSVLLQRMLQENDFALIEPEFFSASNVGGEGPAIGKPVGALRDAHDISALKAQE